MEHPVFGNGYGATVDGLVRSVQEPYSFELVPAAFLMKFGVVGVLFWFCFFMMLMRECGKRIRLNVYYGFATQNWIFAAIFASIPAILAASLTNPYLLNSVGMGILALFILIMVSEKHPIAFKPAIKLKNMTDKIPVSVIIPCYNCKNTILRALNSVVTQTQKPQEIILINDGSQDETGEIIKISVKFGENGSKH